MKSSVLIFCLVFCAAAPLLLAQDMSATKPCLEVVGTADFNFGTIEQSSTVKHTFELVNTCADTLHITNAQASCGCTAAVISEKDLPPGGKGAIEVKFTPPTGTRGNVSKTVSVYLRDNPSPVTVLRIAAKVATDIEINPNYVQLMGAQVGKEVSGKVSITNASTEDVELSELQANMTAYTDTTKGGDPNGANTTAIQMENVKVSIGKKVLKPNESTDVTIAFVPKWQGQVSGSVTVKTKKGQTFVQVYGIVKGVETTGSSATPQMKNQ